MTITAKRCKSSLLHTAAMACLALSAASCGKTEKEPVPDPEPVPSAAEAICILNEGNFYQNISGSLNILSLPGNKMENNVFSAANGRSIGDTPMCGIAYGSRIYLGISESNTVEVIDGTTYESVKQINLNETTGFGSTPYSMAADGGNVYVCMFDGHVARLDTVALEFNASVEVGPNPDRIALHKGKIYVPNSDGMNWQNGYGTTASVVDPATMTLERTFEVPLNPVQFMEAGDALCLLCMGDYGDVPAALYRINADLTCTFLAHATLAAPMGNLIAAVNQPFTEGEPVVEYITVDPYKAKTTPWVIDRPDYANGIFYDDENATMYISSYVMDGPYPSYLLPGYVNCYTRGDGGYGTPVRHEVGAGRAHMFKKK